MKQNRVRSGCQELDAAELLAKEQEAARAAAELLEQLEKEEAAKSVKLAKKKKKGERELSCCYFCLFWAAAGVVGWIEGVVSPKG